MDPNKSSVQYFNEFKMYVSYNDIIKAIKPWGIVEAILVSPGILGLDHLFVVQFKYPISIMGARGKGVYTDSYGGIDDTPFFLRGMHRDGIAVYNVILSPNKIAFDISYLSVLPQQKGSTSECWNRFNGGALLASAKMVPDERLRPYANESSWSENLHKELESLFTRDEKAAKILAWITASGEAFLKRGISVTLVDNTQELIKDIPTVDIISNYRDNNWIVAYDDKS